MSTLNFKFNVSRLVAVSCLGAGLFLQQAAAQEGFTAMPKLATGQLDFFASKGYDLHSSNRYVKYPEWLAEQGGSSALSVSPILEGKVAGQVNNPPTESVDAVQFDRLVQAFFATVNNRNAKGRRDFEFSSKDYSRLLEQSRNGSYVVETVLSGTVAKPISSISLDANYVLSLLQKADSSHQHHPISGKMAQNALEKDHIFLNQINQQATYLLSVYDFNSYSCGLLRAFIATQASDDAQNKDVIYTMSDIQINQSQGFTDGQRMTGKRPDAVISQTIFFASDFIQGAQNNFYLYAEGDSTRVVFVSNIALKSKYFEGQKGAIARDVLLGGIRNTDSTIGIAGTVVTATNNGFDSLKNLISGAEQDAEARNICNRGLAIGLIKYSQVLFEDFLIEIEEQ